MLLHIEGARVETPLETEGVELASRHDKVPSQSNGIGDQLGDESRDDDRGGSQGEQHVHARAESDHEHTDDPCADGVGGHIDIVVADRGTDFGVWRVVLHQIDEFELGGAIVVMDGSEHAILDVGRQVGIPSVKLLQEPEFSIGFRFGHIGVNDIVATARRPDFIKTVLLVGDAVLLEDAATASGGSWDWRSTDGGRLLTPEGNHGDTNVRNLPKKSDLRLRAQNCKRLSRGKRGMRADTRLCMSTQAAVACGTRQGSVHFPKFWDGNNGAIKRKRATIERSYRYLAPTVSRMANEAAQDLGRRD